VGQRPHTRPAFFACPKKVGKETAPPRSASSLLHCGSERTHPAPAEPSSGASRRRARSGPQTDARPISFVRSAPHEGAQSSMLFSYGTVRCLAGMTIGSGAPPCPGAPPCEQELAHHGGASPRRIPDEEERAESAWTEALCQSSGSHSSTRCICRSQHDHSCPPGPSSYVRSRPSLRAWSLNVRFCS
jgi:hypothetical protein